VWLRAILADGSFCGVVSTQFLSSSPVDPNVVSADVPAFIATRKLAFFAHAFYNLPLRRF
jgi:hypothetical protein